MAGGAVITTAGTAAAAVPEAHSRVTSFGCFDHDTMRCFDNGGFRFDNGGFRFHHRGFCFDHPGFCFPHRFDNGSVVIIVLR